MKNIEIQRENYNQFEEGELIKIVGIELKRIANDVKLGIDFITICACALELLDKFLGGEYDFPIDIEKIAERLGIEVIYQPLNGIMGQQDGRPHRIVGRNFKRVNRETNAQSCYILLDDESRHDEQRYAFAHELAHYLMHIDEKRYGSKYCSMPMLFKNMEEMVADIFALFLLIPLPIFLGEFVTYLGNQADPVRTSEWLKYLSLVSEVPYENVAIGYEIIRYVCGVVYGIMKNGLKVKNENADIDVILQRQIKKIQSVLTEDVIEKLFC